MKALQVKESIVINKQPATVFDFTQDYNKRLQWATFLKKAVLINKAPIKKGVQALCVAKNGFAMITEYVTFNRQDVTAIKMTKGPFFFKSFSGSWRFKSLPGEQTEVIFLYSFTLRFPFSLMKGFVQRNLGRNVRQRLIDLKQNIERT